MKRYLLVGIALLFVSANASLKEDFLEMDLAEAQMLSDMRKSAALNDDIDEDEEVTEEETVVTESIEEPAPDSQEEVLAPSSESNVSMADSVGAVTSELDSVVNESDSEEREDSIRQKVMDEAREKNEAEKASAAKAEALKTEIDAKAAEITKVKEAQEKAAAEQQAAEKREVEAYEKERAEKLAKEAATKAAQKVELEKKQLAQKALDAAAKEKSIEKTSVKETKEVVIAVGDVNISRELEEKTQAANEDYENAVKEMQEKD